ncbi:DUF350 domain-containing protein [bacterium]|nr:DUF350 domain-containing protein [bacterium]
MSDQVIGIVSGLAHLVLSFGLALLTTYGSFRILDRLLPGDDLADGLRADNRALAALLGGVLIASALIVKASTEPIIATVQVFLFRAFSWMTLFRSLAMIAAYVLGAVLVANLTIWLGVRCFFRLTDRIDELSEIRRNNLAVGIAIGVTVAVMGYLVSGGVGDLMQALVPFPEFRPVEILGG